MKVFKRYQRFDYFLPKNLSANDFPKVNGVILALLLLLVSGVGSKVAGDLFVFFAPADLFFAKYNAVPNAPSFSSVERFIIDSLNAKV